MIEKKKILILVFSNLSTDPRVYRQLVALTLRDDCKVTAVGYDSPNLEDVNFISIPKDSSSTLRSKIVNAIRLKLGQFEKYYWSSISVCSALQSVSEQTFDVIIANDINTLPLALKLAEQKISKVLIDAHEYQPKHLDNLWRFRFFFQKYWDYICREYLPRVDAMTSVCDGIAEEYEKEYGVTCGVVTNAPFFKDLEPTSVTDTIRMIHHGGINRIRKIENMILLMDRLDERFTLDFMLMTNQLEYLEELKTLAASRPQIRFIPPVPMPEISACINQYDIGLYMLPPDSFNCRMALPNKLFEFIQGRLAVAVWPSPEMAKVVNRYLCGVVSSEFSIESMADELNKLSAAEIQHLKSKASTAAPTLCAEAEFKSFNHVIDRLLSHSATKH